MNNNPKESRADNRRKPALAEPGLNTEPLLTVEEVARYLRLKPGTVRNMARRGELPVVKIGRRWRFKRSLIENWLRDNMIEQA